MAKVVFIHPDLGIGGAERLVIDAAMALKKKGHEVLFLTAHHDPMHCFSETIDGSVEVICRGDWLPRSLFGCCYALWAYIRMIYITLYLVFFSSIEFDVAFVDQISACIPILHLKKKYKVIFYCHYPDQLLTTRSNILKKAYRYFIDKLEEKTTAVADCILVNSNFTSKIFKDTFKSIDVAPSVLYPSLDFKRFDIDVPLYEKSANVIFLSINRYERKKDVSLAIKAFELLLRKMKKMKLNLSVKLIVAGGYDERVVENIEYYRELVTLTEELELQNSVKFLRSPSDEAKVSLLLQATCLLYTPTNEHFGIVPIESMYCGTPVIAANSGGPLETVIDGETGFLSPPTPEDFAYAMLKFINGTVTKDSLGRAGKKHVIDKFSFNTFISRLDYVVQSLIDERKRK